MNFDNIKAKLAQNGLECHLKLSKIKNFLGTCFSLAAEMPSKTIDIFSSVHKTCQIWS